MKKNLIIIGLFLIVGFLALEEFVMKKPAVKNEWVNLQNLGANINSKESDDHAIITRDGSVMYFCSNRSGGPGGYDLYMSRYIKGSWTKAELLPSPLNSESDEVDPSVTPDGKRLFFSSNRHTGGPYWDCDLYVSEWNGDAWSEPKLMEEPFIWPGKPDSSITMTDDLRILLFASGRKFLSPGTIQIFMSLNKKGKWTDPVTMPEPVNTGYYDASPCLTADARILYTTSLRSTPEKYVESKTDVDIWKFEYIDGKWTNATLVPFPVNSEYHDYDPFVTADGKNIYFTSNRQGGLGSSDIYVVEARTK